MTRDLKNDRWTCPNDRNLQLRSKLNAGWSIHTGKRTHKKDLQLTENELLEIQKVLQRSEALERNERERVLKMVDRLENLKRNASQTNCATTQNRCGICGDYFCLIRASPNLCGSCQRVLCNKCSIDTPFNYEDYMNTASANGGTNPSTYNANAGSSRRSSSISLTGASGNFSSHSPYPGSNGAIGGNGRMFVYLCRLCSEQREFLKKSGIWFLRKYPNYVLNADKFNSTSNISEMERVPSSASKASFISPMGLKRNLSTSSSNSSSFRFWKNLNMQYFQNEANTADNVSDISNDIDQHHIDMINNFNYDEHNRNLSSSNAADNGGLYKNRNVSNELMNPGGNSQNIGIHHQSLGSNSPTYSRHQLSQIEHLGLNNHGSNSMNSATESSSISSPSPAASRPSPLATDKKPFGSIASNWLKSDQQNDHSYDEDDDDSVSDTPTSPNMTSYNYYSSIIANINPTNTSLNLVKNEGINGSMADKYDKNGLTLGTSNTAACNQNQNETPQFLKAVDETILNTTKSIENRALIGSSDANEMVIRPNKSLENVKNINSNKCISASVSDLDMNDFNPERAGLNDVSDVSARNVKNKRGLEWCSTQLSMEETNSGKSEAKMFSNRINRDKPVHNDNQSQISNRLSRSNAPKISSHTVNNLAKKILSQNNSIVAAASSGIAASSSSAVSSASSLASGLTKLNLK